MQQTKQYKNYLITTLVLFAVSTNALADGFKDGQFFAGASTSIQQDAYKLDKPNSAPQARVHDLSGRVPLTQIALSAINNQLEIYKAAVGSDASKTRNPFSMFGGTCLTGCSSAGITEFYINKKGYKSYEALSKIKTVTNDNILEVVELISTIQTEKIKAQKETVAFHQWFLGLAETHNTTSAISSVFASSTATEEVKNSEIYKNMIAWFNSEKQMNFGNAVGRILISIGNVLGRPSLYEMYSSENFLVGGEVVYNSADVKDLTQVLIGIMNSTADRRAETLTQALSLLQDGATNPLTSTSPANDIFAFLVSLDRAQVATFYQHLAKNEFNGLNSNSNTTEIINSLTNYLYFTPNQQAGLIQLQNLQNDNNNTLDNAEAAEIKTSASK
jgi:hypothetical protein